LVRAFRGLIWQERQRYVNIGGERLADRFPPASIVRSALSEKTGRFAVPTEEKHIFFHEIKQAWDAIAWQHYQWDPANLSADQINARWYLSHRHFAAKRGQDPHPELIRLDPLQVRILDALAEAADVPHQRGQAEIEIPDHLRHEAEDHLRETYKKNGWDESNIFGK
jgi:hypothetical protein